MRNMLRQIAGIAAMGVLGAALLTGLAACGGSSGASSTSANSSSGDAPASATPPSSPGLPASNPAPAAPASVAQSTTPNVQPIRVAAIISGARNILQTSVTICVPGTSTCQTIDNIQVDTGSQGLRILASALSPALALPAVTTSASGATAASCTVFGTGYTWGAVRSADVRMAGQLAAATSIQVIADPAVPAASSDCAKSGLPMLTASILRGNGILGVGPFNADCGNGCASSALPRWYYACTSAACAPSTLPLAQQVSNPVGRFATDNNGVVIELPAVPDAGASAVAGTMTFGIGSQANNLLGNATVLKGGASTGYVTTAFDGQKYPTSFIDSGSNGLFFPSGTLARCGSWFCPSAPQTLAARMSSGTAAAIDVSFSVSMATGLFASGNSALANLAGPVSGYFDWGLPFFFGRRVFTALEGRVTPAGNGPYYAF